VTDAQREEREDIVHGLDVLAGLMACLVAVDEREREYTEPVVVQKVGRRTERVAAHWLERVA
jgi:hypothetical protein